MGKQALLQWSFIDEETFLKYQSLAKNIDFRELTEFEDNTDLQGELACAGGACEI